MIEASDAKELRAPTLDLSVGVGRFRWGDGKAAVERHVPDAMWGLYESLYLFKRCYFAEAVLELVPGTWMSAYIDPDDHDGHQVVRLGAYNLDRTEPTQRAGLWTALTELARAWGWNDASLRPGVDHEWTHARVSISLSVSGVGDEVTFYLTRPLAAPKVAASKKRGAEARKLRSCVDYDFDVSDDEGDPDAT